MSVFSSLTQNRFWPRISSLFEFFWPEDSAVSFELGRWRKEKKQFEAFMHSIPYEYCGWDEKGVRVSSPGLYDLVGTNQFETLEDILGCLEGTDAKVLQKNYETLVLEKKEFAQTVQLESGQRTLSVQGRLGQNFSRKNTFHILWFRDITEEIDEKEQVSEQIDSLEQSERICQSTFQTLPYPMWIRDDDLSLVWCNEAYASAVEKKSVEEAIEDQQEILGKRKSVSLAQKVHSENKMSSIQDHAVLNGERRYVEIVEAPLEGEKKQFGFLKDLDDIRSLQAEIKRFATANTEILEQLSTPVAVFNQDMTLDFYNSAYSNLWGLSEKWLDSRPNLPEIMEKSRENRRLPETADFRSYVENRKSWFTSLLEPHEEMMYLPDGRVLRLLVIPYPQGGIMVTYEDVTSRLELESSYNILIAVQRETIDNLAEGISVFGADGRLKLSNAAYKKIWGFKDKDLENEPHVSTLVDMVKHYFLPENWDYVRNNLIESCLKREEKSSRFNRSDGSILDYNLVPLPDGALLCSYVDVTDTVRVEQALRERNQALEEAERLKSQFLANVSYQLRTPLNAMMGFADILNRKYFGDLTEKQSEYTAGIIEAGTRLVTLIDDILDLSTIEAGYLELDLGQVSIRDLMGSLQSLTEEWARKEELKISYHCPKNIGSVLADETRLKQALLNIIQNAINFTEEGGIIDIRAKRRKDKIEITIQDNGIGIHEDDLKDIFQPFIRVQRTKQKRGAGIGLSLVKSILDLHGGTIEIESDIDNGTKVTCCLPLKKK